MDTTRATAELVDAARVEANLTRRDLSDASGIAYATLHRKLNGHVPFNVEEIATIAGIVRKPAASLVPFGAAA